MGDGGAARAAERNKGRGGGWGEGSGIREEQGQGWGWRPGRRAARAAESSTAGNARTVLNPEKKKLLWVFDWGPRGNRSEHGQGCEMKGLGRAERTC